MENTQTKSLYNDQELIALLKAGENEHVEWTESLDKDKIAKNISAFSNDLAHTGKTGVIFIGVKDNGKIAGLSVTDKMLVNISDFSRHGNLQPFPLINVRKWVHKSYETILVEVQPSTSPPIRYKGCCYVRIGPSVRVATAEEESRLLEKRQSALLPEDMRGVNTATISEDLDLLYFRTHYLQLKAMGSFILALVQGKNQP